MRLIKKTNVIQDAQAYPADIQKRVLAWCKVVKQTEWASLDDIRKTYDHSVDQVGKFLVFNIKSYRLIVICNFKAQIIYYRFLLTHQEYDKGKLRG
jgi:mRNA interferase HigB